MWIKSGWRWWRLIQSLSRFDLYLQDLDLQGIHQGGETSKETGHLVSSQDGPDVAWQSGLRDNEEGSLFKVGCGRSISLLNTDTLRGGGSSGRYD